MPSETETRLALQTPNYEFLGRNALNEAEWRTTPLAEESRKQKEPEKRTKKQEHNSKPCQTAPSLHEAMVQRDKRTYGKIWKNAYLSRGHPKIMS